MPEPRACAGCQQHTIPRRDGLSSSSWMTEFGRVDRVDDVCPERGHVMVENLSGSGARAWAESRSVELVPDAA